MGERHSGGGLPGRRGVHPDGRTHPDPDGSGLAELLGAALRETVVDAEAEHRAVAAFRTAREAGARRARTRQRDDWRPRERGLVRRSLKATVAMLLASLTVGGVAIAAIGTSGSPGTAHGDPGRTVPSARATRSPAVRPSSPAAPSVSGPASADRPATAKDTLAHCRAYESVKDHGKALDATAWQRLVTAAGGEADVASYCAEQVAAAEKDGRTAKTKKVDKADKAEKVASGAGGSESTEKADEGGKAKPEK
ncbi:hypothetical protein [Streptomyces sp. NPDC051636]|uniref:hypothetical protein n=1 Tax=Streptomyces sp. NPDC051636 TaxID=3365663 RepID=UPI003787A4B3